MRTRWHIDLPKFDADAAVIRSCLGHLSPRERATMIRRLLALACRTLLRQTRKGAAVEMERDWSTSRQPVPPRAASPASSSAPMAADEDRDASDTQQLALLAKRLRIPIISGGHRYDDHTHDDHTFES